MHQESVAWRVLSDTEKNTNKKGKSTMKQKKRSNALLCFLLCAVMVVPVLVGSICTVKAAEQQTIIIGTNAEYSPFEYLD